MKKRHFIQRNLFLTHILRGSRERKHYNKKYNITVKLIRNLVYFKQKIIFDLNSNLKIQIELNITNTI